MSESNNLHSVSMFATDILGGIGQVMQLLCTSLPFQSVPTVNAITERLLLLLGTSHLKISSKPLENLILRRCSKTPNNSV